MTLKLTLYLTILMCVCATSFAQEKPIHSILKWIHKLETLESSAYKGELELVEDQLIELKEIRKRAAEIVHAAITSQGTEVKKETAIKDAVRQLNQEVSDILLPHQVERLNQISIQRGTKVHASSSIGLLSPTLVRLLDISNEQKDEIEKRAKEFDERKKKLVAKFLEDVEELQKQSSKSVLAVLDNNQQEKYNNIVGPSARLKDVWKHWK